MTAHPRHGTACALAESASVFRDTPIPALHQEEADYRAKMVDRAVPFHLHGGLLLYLVHHIRPVGFLMAALENNLTEAVLLADMESQIGLFDLVQFLFNDMPADAWGSREKVEQWIA